MKPEQKEKARQWVEQKGLGNSPCPACSGNAGLGIGELLGMPFMPEDLSQPIPVTGRRIAVFVPVTCQDCGYLRLFAADAMGILPPKE